jgi:predicted RNase H-like HicB family nuclease
MNSTLGFWGRRSWERAEGKRRGETKTGSVSAARYTGSMARKASVVIEKDQHGFYAWCPELKGCQSQGKTLEETVANIKEAIELYLETLPANERNTLLSQEILTTTVEVNA